MPLSVCPRFGRDTSGSIVTIFAIAIIPLLTAAGVALDYIRASFERAQLQMAIDTAVLAGVWKDAGADRDTYAAAYAQAKLAHVMAAEHVQLSFRTNPDSSYTGTAEADVPAAILPVIGIKTLKIAATATALAVEGSAGRVCLLLNDPNASQSLLVNGGAAVTAPDCEIHVRSKANPAAIVNGGTALHVKRICVAGDRVILNGNAKPPLETGCDAVSDPFAGLFPAPGSLACTASNRVIDPKSAETVMEPGVYCGWTIFNGTQNIRFKPGTYVIRNGGMIINGNSVVNGDGVTFYLADQNATITMNGGLTVNLTAPDSGPLQGVLMYEPDGLPKSQLAFNGSTRTNFDGLLHLPSRNVTFNATSNIASERLAMVFNTLILNNANWRFEPAGRSIPVAGSGGGTRAVRLVN